MPAPPLPPTLRLGIDTGGTFTDLILYAGPDHPWLTHKVPSTPADPAQAVLAGMAYLLGLHFPDEQTRPAVAVTHGSTVATNALLEGTGATVAFVTTAGFEDTLHIARQNRPDLYALVVARPEPPVARTHCLGLPERMRYDGTPIHPPTSTDITALVVRLQTLGVQAVAVSLLHSYANPAHERQLAEALRAALPAVHLTVAHDVLPEFREYERAATCLANAVVAPRMAGYLGTLAEACPPGGLQIMVSGGGTLPPEAVRRHPVHTLLSGPAGGVLGAWRMAQAAGIDRIVTFDMGGTSTDVSLCHKGLTYTTETEIAGLPVRLPMVDIHTVGAGGGSLARVDAGGALRVGPASAGADPGPACYGRQTPPYRATVTDAHVVLGHLRPGDLLGGAFALHPEAAHTALQTPADALGLDVQSTAEGILRIAEATMARAIQRISVQRGHDVRDFTLLPFGGAGALHACRLAETLGMHRVLLPLYPGLLSAAGMLAAAPRFSYTQGLLLTLPAQAGTHPDPKNLPIVAQTLNVLRAKATAALGHAGLDPAACTLAPALDLRYQGQAYELTLPYAEANVISAFHALHQQRYGYTASDKPIEVVALRLDAAGPDPVWSLPPFMPPADAPQPAQEADGWTRSPRAALALHQTLTGPALLHEYSTTTLIPKGWTAKVLPGGLIEIKQ